MPVDSTNAAQREQQRRQSRKVQDEVNAEGHTFGGHAREIELKRSRGEISCAECRRLKIKCDKKLPCSSCQRRGCASLCPNGSLATGQGTRFVLAATDHLHKRIALMSNRIRQLEDALAVLQSGCSKEPHPLLRDELLTLKLDKEDAPVEAGEEQPEVIDSFGTLSISDKGTSRFFGTSGGTELLLLNDDDVSSQSTFSSPDVASMNAGATPPSTRSSRSPCLAPEITRFSNAFPFTPMGPSHEVQDLIESHLPRRDRALALAESYIEGAAWLFRTVSKQQLVDEMLPAIYARIEARTLDPAKTSQHQGQYQGTYTGPHDLAVLFMVFAIGALVDLKQEPFNAEGEHFYNLAKAAVCLQSVLEKSELATIQALHLMSIFNAMNQPSDGNESETSMEMSWALIRLCHQLAQTIGLHRDSARWGLTPKDVQRRRALFWDLFVADSWQSLATGRPPSITMPYIDTQYPLDDEAFLTDEGQTEPGYGAWGFRFAAECVTEVAIKTSMAQVPPYSSILELDRKLRDYHIPDIPMPPPGPDGKVDLSKASIIMTRYVLLHSREVMLLHLHRSFFAQAMIDDPVNPVRSQYAPSFLAAYRSASQILKCIKEQFELLPQLCARFWSTWTFAFSAAVVFGTIVTRGPGSTMARSSLEELDTACEMFGEAGKYSRRAAKASVILQKLQAKARNAYDAFIQNGGATANPGASLQPPNTRLSPEGTAEGSQDEDELAIFGGRTRVLSPKRLSPSPMMAQAMNVGDRSTPPGPSSAYQSQQGGPAPVISGQRAQYPQDIKPPLPLAVALSSSSSNSSAGAGSVDSGLRDMSSPPSSMAEYGERGMPTWSTSREYREERVSYDAFPAYSQIANTQPNQMYGKQEWLSQQQQGGSDLQAYQPYSSGGQPPFRSAPGSYPYQQRLSPQGQGYPSVSVSVEFNGTGSQQMSAQHSPYAPTPTPGSGGPASQYPFTPPPVATPYGNTPSQYAYSPAPRDLTAMGLAAQHSGMNQRWTSYMQDSGVFYGGGNVNAGM